MKPCRLLAVLVLFAVAQLTAWAQLIPPRGRPDLVSAPEEFSRFTYAWPGVPVHVLAGGKTFPDGLPRQTDGVGKEVSFSRLNAITVAPDGTIWVADGWDVSTSIVNPLPSRIRTVSPHGVVQTVVTGVPSWESLESPDGPLGVAKIRAVTALAAAPDGTIWFADDAGLRRLIPGQRIETLAPSQYVRPPTGDGNGSVWQHNGGLTVIPPNPASVIAGQVRSLTFLGANELWWVEGQTGNQVRRLHSGSVSTLPFPNRAGEFPAPPPFQDGRGTNAWFQSIRDLAPHPDGGAWANDAGMLRHVTLDEIRTVYRAESTNPLARDGLLRDLGIQGGPLAAVTPQLLATGDFRLTLLRLREGNTQTLAGGRYQRPINVTDPPFVPGEGWWWQVHFHTIEDIAVGPNGVLYAIDWWQGQIFHTGGPANFTDPLIYREPEDLTVSAGETARLSVGADGTAPLAFQWFRGEAELTGETNDVLAFVPARVADSGDYSVRVSNPNGTATSRTARLTVQPVAPPVIVSGPTNLTVFVGEAARLAVTATGEGLSYRWFFGEHELADQTGATLIREPATLDHAGGYRVQVSNAGGSVTSDVAVLTVREPLVAPRIVVDLQPVTVRAGESFTLRVQAAGSEPLQYLWYHDFSWMPDETNSTYTVRSASLLDTGSYYVLVRNAAGGVNSRDVDVRVLPNLPDPPRLVRHPLPAQVLAGTTATFSVFAEGSGLAFQWFKDGTALPGQTGQNLRLTNVNADDQGWYAVRISNAVGEVRSVPRWLAVTDGLVRLWGEARQDLTPPVDLHGVVSVATGDNHALALLQDGRVRAWGRREAFENVSTFWKGPRLVYDEDGRLIDVLSSETVTNRSSIVDLEHVVAVAAAGDYSLALLDSGSVRRFGSYSADDGPVDHLRVQPAFAQMVAAPDTAYFLTQDGKLHDFNGRHLNFAPHLISVAAGNGFLVGLDTGGRVWSWGELANPPAGLSNVVAVTAGQFHAAALRSDGSVVQWGQLLDETGDPAPADQVAPAPPGPWIGFAAGPDYTLGLKRDGSAFGWGGRYFDFLRGHEPRFVRLTQAALGPYHGIGLGLPRLDLLPPVIVQEPADTVVTAGTTLRLQVVAGGSSPFTYQWFHDRTLLPGAHGAVLEISRANLFDAGRYEVLVRNGVDAVASRAAQVEVRLLGATFPEITRQPREQRVIRGRDAVFSVAAAGEGPLRYQWFRDDSPLPGATDAVLELRDTTSAQAGFYAVEVTGARGTTRSFPARLLVLTGALTELGRGGEPLAEDAAEIVQHVARDERSLQLLADGSVTLFRPDSETGIAGLAAHLASQFSPDPDSPPIQRTLHNIAQIGLERDRVVALDREGRVQIWSTRNGEFETGPSLREAFAIASGRHHSLAAQVDGRVVAWGDPDNPAATVPAHVRDIVAVAAGELHSLALRSDGTVFAWGNNLYGQSVVPFRVRDVVHLCAGPFHNLALTRSGQVVAWGSNGSGQCDVPADLQDVIALAADTHSSAALKRDGTVVLWGEVSRNPPAVPNGLSEVGDLAGAEFGLWALGPVRNDQRRPEVWINSRSQTALSAGRTAEFHARATGARPLHFQWHRNGVPLVGEHGATLTVAVTPELAGWYSVTVSNRLGTATSLPRRLAVTTGRLFGFGDNGHGQSDVPSGAEFDRRWTDVAGGARHTVGVLETGLPALAFAAEKRAVAWGDSADGQTAVPNRLDNVATVAAGDRHSLALHADGRVFGWGANESNQRLPAEEDFHGHRLLKVAAGRFHSVGVDTAGNLLAWGIRHAELFGFEIPQFLPNDHGQGRAPDTFGPFVDVAAGELHNLALRADGTVIQWGGTVLTRGMPEGLTNVIALAAGRFHSMALRADGTVVTWGSALLGEPVPDFALEPVNPEVLQAPANLDRVVDIAAGDGFCAALREDGEIITWGEQPPPIPTGRRFAKIAAGHRHLLGLERARPESPLVITAHPAGTVAVRGTTVRLQVEAAGISPISFQWLQGTTVLPGATNSVLELPGIEPAAAGRYRVLVSNPEAELLSRSADVIVLDRDLQLRPETPTHAGRLRFRLETDRPTTPGARRHAYVELSEDFQRWIRLDAAFNPDTGEVELPDTAAGGFVRLVVP